MRRNCNILFSVTIASSLLLASMFPMEADALTGSRQFTNERLGNAFSVSQLQGQQPANTVSSQPTTPLQEQVTNNGGQGTNQTGQLVSNPGTRDLGRTGRYLVPSSPVPAPIAPSQPSLPQKPSEPENDIKIPPAPVGLIADEARVFEMVNEFRIANGQEPVNINMKLVEVARMKAQDMVDNNYFAHNSPTYGSPANMVRAAGISAGLVGENLSKAGNAVQAQVQLMYSTKGHREIMLRDRYKEVGIGIAKLNNTPGIVLVQIFIEPR